MLPTPQILAENDDYLVVMKEPGWFSVPAREPKESDIVLSHLMSALTPDPRVVHRLDRFTSGVMLFAKSPLAQKTASSWFEKRIVKKTYVFLASPVPSKPALQARSKVNGKAAQTLFEVIEKAGPYFFGKAIPQTGRFHQIREHAQVSGFPLLGDSKFGGEVGFPECPRICLHASRLDLPFGKYEAPLPSDMLNLWKRLKDQSV